MSTKEERRFRAQRRIRPIEVTVRQKDGTVVTQWIEADMTDRRQKRTSRPPPGSGNRDKT